MYKKTIDEFEYWASKYPREFWLENSHSYILDIPDSVTRQLIDYFSLNLDEVILWYVDTAFFFHHQQGMVVTDQGITIVEDSDNDFHVKITWKDFSKVKYKGEKLYFFDSYDDFQLVINFSFFHDGEEERNRIANIFTEMAETQDSPQKALSRIEESLECDDYKDVLKETKKIFLMTDDEETIAKASYYKALAMYNLEKRGPGLARRCAKRLLCRIAKVEYVKEPPTFKEVLNFINDFEKGNDLSSEMLELKGDIYTSLVHINPSDENSAINARKYYQWAIKDCDEKQPILEKYQQANNLLFDNFFERDLSTNDEDDNLEIETSKFCDYVPARERQFICFVRNFKMLSGEHDEKENINWVFSLDQIPSDILINEVPRSNVLYMAHPVRPNVYIPFEGASDTLFLEKIDEFSYLLQCLGATEITFHSRKGIKASEAISQKDIKGGEAGVNRFGATLINIKGSSESLVKNDQSKNYNNGTEFRCVYDPRKYPYQPEDLLWLKFDTSWKNMIKQRLNGDILEYHCRINSNQVCNLSNEQKSDVKAAFGSLYLNIDGSKSSSEDTLSNKSEETEWSIDVKFKPIHQFLKRG